MFTSHTYKSKNLSKTLLNCLLTGVCFLCIGFSSLKANPKAASPCPPADKTMEFLASQEIQTATMDLPTGFSSGSTVSISPINNPIRINYSYEISGNGSLFTLHASSGSPLPANTLLAAVTITDPVTQATVSATVSTDGGATLLVLADF